MSILKNPENSRNFKNEKDINRMIRQISEPSFSRQTNGKARNQRSYSFLIGKQLKRLDLNSVTTSSSLCMSSSPSTTTTHLSSHNPTEAHTTPSYFFNRQSQHNGSFMRKSFMKTRSSLEIISIN